MLQYIRLISLALLVSVGFGTVAKAASFDCNKATTETELAICADPELGALDVKLSSLWGFGHRSATEVEEQKDWLELRNRFSIIPACMPDNSCIQKHYEYRIMELITGCDVKIEVSVLYELPTDRRLDEIMSASDDFEECRSQYVYQLRGDFEKLSDLFSSIPIEGCSIVFDVFVYDNVSSRAGHHAMSRCSGNALEHYQMILEAMEILIDQSNIDEKNKLYADRGKWKNFANQACSFYDFLFEDAYFGNIGGVDKCKADIIKSRILYLSPLIGVDEAFGWPAGTIDEVLGDYYGEFRG